MRKRFLLPLIGLFVLTSCQTISKTEVHKKVIVTEASEVEVIEIKNDIASVYKDVYDSCVGIYVKDSTGEGSGSGVIYKYDEATQTYYVVTNSHVVKDMTTVKVFDGDSIYYSANVLGYDTLNDVAVITFTTDMLGENRSFKPINFFKEEYEDLVTVGQSAIVVGCPLGLSNYNHLSVGVVSLVQTNRIFTDATVNPGNSGGGLFNMAGRLIGLINSKTVWTTQTENGVTQEMPVEGMGYAIPLNVLKKCILDIESIEGAVTRNRFGMYVTMVNSLLGDENYETYKEYLPEGEEAHAYVVVKSFIDGSKAKECGVKEGDVILKINDISVKTNNELSSVFDLVSPDEDVKLTIYRSSLQEVIEITVSWK